MGVNFTFAFLLDMFAKATTNKPTTIRTLSDGNVISLLKTKGYSNNNIQYTITIGRLNCENTFLIMPNIIHLYL